MSVRAAVGGVGRVLLTAGILILLFVAYQLWGTGIYEARAQDNLRNQFKRDLSHRRSVSTTTPASTAPLTTGGTSTSTTAPTSTTIEPLFAPAIPSEGDPVGIIRIPRIGVDKVVVEGTEVPDLRKGPGHYPGTPLPGEFGNAAIAGHRTTYGAPFGDLDQLHRGDTIDVRTLAGTYTYVLTDDPFAVSPDETKVLLPTLDEHGRPLATLTLTTCNPKYSASERLIVKAQLSQDNKDVAVQPPRGQRKVKLQTGLSGTRSPRTPTIVWGIIAALVGAVWWLSFHRYPRWTTWVIGAVPFAVTLLFFYVYLERALPTNY